jgi:putative lipoic acid-binding regulatory protein
VVDMSDDTSSDNAVTELMEFPCQFPLKVIGLNRPEFEQIALDLIRLHCPADTHFAVKKNNSRLGKYLSLTITFTAYSRQQMNDIYQSLTDSEDVVMSL